MKADEGWLCVSTTTPHPHPLNHNPCTDLATRPHALSQAGESVYNTAKVYAKPMVNDHTL